MKRCFFTVVVVGYLFLVGKIAAEQQQQQQNSGGMITMTTSSRESGAVDVSITTTRIKGFYFSIAVVDPFTDYRCDPAAGATGKPLDLRDAFTSDKDISPSIAGAVWNMRDPGDGTRVYTTTLSTALLRQQFVKSAPKDVAAVGAVTGGSVGAFVHACLFRRASANEGTGGLVAGWHRTPIVAGSSADANPLDMRAVILTPIAFVDANTAKVTVQTTVFGTCVDADSRISNPPPVTHSATTIKARSAPECDSRIDLGADCMACIQTFTVDAVVESKGDAMDVVSRFVEPKSGTRFVGHFIVNPPHTCSQEDGTCAKTVRDEPKPAEDKVRAIGLGNTPIVAVVTSNRVKTARVDHVHQKAREDPTQEIAATIYNGAKTCIELATNDGAEGAVRITDVVMVPSGGDAIVIVDDGVVDDQMARFSAARLKSTKNGGDEVCFAGYLRGSSSRIKIGWEADPKKKSVKREEDGERHDDGSRPDWCFGTDICVGTVYVNADHEDYGHREKGNDSASGVIAVFFFIFFVVVVIGLIWVCVASSGHHHHASSE
jgi:hypothetical protein